MIRTRAQTVLTGNLGADLSPEGQATLVLLTKDLVDRISSLFLTTLTQDKLNPADYIGERLGIVFTIEGGETEDAD